MEITFGEGFSGQEQAELDAVLQRIGWRERPDSLHIRARLTDGRSGCTVLDVVARAGPRATSMVAKVGPFHDLKDEWSAFNEHLHDASALFAPILAVTPAVLGSMKSTGDREAVVYDHASRFAGLPDHPPVTFEKIAWQAIRKGGKTLEGAEQVLKTLFTGIQNDLYAKHAIDDRETSALDAWNLRLGIALEIEVDGFAKASKVFELSGSTGPPMRLYPLTLLEAADRHDGKVEPGAWVEVRDLKAEWWDDRLMGQLPEKSLRLEVVPTGGLSLRRASKLAEGATFHVRGRVRSVRARAHHQWLHNGLPELADARMADPFEVLPRILEDRRRGRLTALVHGDLNPRNVLLAGDRPILIDYAFTRDGEPFFLDFTRLEGCLARDVLPEDLSLAQHLRLQRLLAAACRLGERSVDHFAQRLAADRAELGAAFRICWALRRAARDACPDVYREHWLRDYLEQLFLFAHLTLKWPEPEQAPAALRATAAMAGVAAETLSGAGLYRHWNEEDLHGDGLEILRLSEPPKALGDLAAMARVLRGLRKEEDKPLIDAFEVLRADFVRSVFSKEANQILVDLEADHGFYISLLAYIDLRGRLHAGSARREMSFDAMLESDEALAEAERLRSGERRGEDVLRLLAEQPEIVLIGDAGAGKSTVAREWQYRLAQAITGRGEAIAAPRLPVVMRAPDLRLKIGEREEEDDRTSIATALGREPALLDAGALHVTIDALNELPEAGKQRVAEWLITLRRIFPATPVVACHRQYNYTPGLLPFPVVGLEKVEAEQAKRYVFDYLRENGAADWQDLGERLAALLLDDPEHTQVRDLAQTPLFLWMIVERYRQTRTPPAGRGRLFEDFSRWYLEEKHHKEHGEAVVNRFTFEEKAAFLGRLGYALVERGTTDVEETEVAEWGAKPAILAEIMASEILLRDDGKLRFLHQSFQEYFAARHFLAHEAGDVAAIQKKVWKLGWHDTFAVLLGFAGQAPDVVAAVVEAALAVNPVLTARCLRMTETPVEELLGRFVATQEKVLRDPQEQGYGHQRAARALADHGRGLSRQALLKIAADPATPVPARAEILKILPGLPAQARFEPVREKMRDELQKLLGGIFDEEAPEEVRQTAIEAVAEAELHKLSGYLIEFVQSESPWSLRKAAWAALGTFGVRPTARQQAAFVRACEERLAETEAALYEESIDDRMDALNAERVKILDQIATPERLPLLLRRRLRYRIHDEVRQIIDRVSAQSGEPPEAARTAWEILREAGDETAVAHWWRHVREGSDLDVSAAVHRLAALGEALDPEPLHALLARDIDPDRLAAIAELCGATEDTGLVEPMEKLARGFIESIEGTEAVEAFTRLVEVLIGLDTAQGRRLAALANMIFWVRRQDEARPGFYPWRRLRSEVALDSEDCDVLLSRGGDDAKAAIRDLSTWGFGAVLVAGPISSPTKITEVSLECFREIAEQENDLLGQCLIARAAAELQATGLLPELLSWTNRPEHASQEFTGNHNQFGQYRERSLANILRVIGYLARLLLDSDHPADAADAVAFLDARTATLDEAEDRSIVVACTTALGYHGKWEPILTHLGPGEPWMHRAAHNVFEHWVPEDFQERERAARWIARRLHTHRDLAPEARSTLGKLLERLEQEIGFHVGGEEGG
jgi:hypothetical protein